MINPQRPRMRASGMYRPHSLGGAPPFRSRPAIACSFEARTYLIRLFCSSSLVCRANTYLLRPETHATPAPLPILLAPQRHSTTVSSPPRCCNSSPNRQGWTVLYTGASRMPLAQAAAPCMSKVPEARPKCDTEHSTVAAEQGNPGDR